jgi:hypothetical protein
MNSTEARNFTEARRQAEQLVSHRSDPGSRNRDYDLLLRYDCVVTVFDNRPQKSAPHLPREEASPL